MFWRATSWDVPVVPPRHADVMCDVSGSSPDQRPMSTGAGRPASRSPSRLRPFQRIAAAYSVGLIAWKVRNARAKLFGLS